MGIGELLRWQWDGYPTYHGSRLNLLIHLVAVPLFVVANVALVLAALRLDATGAAISAVVMVASFAAQAAGHGRESVASVPFAGPANAVGRIFLEQWVSFPRFVLSGGWLRAVRAAKPAR